MLPAQDPSEVASTGSGFISPDTNDPTARNTTRACAAADLDASLRVHWNIYPWWVQKKGIDGFPAESFAAAMHAAVPFVDELVGRLLPELGVVVLMGKKAQDGWDRYVATGGLPPAGLRVLRCPHPSPLAYPKGDNARLIIDALSEARRLAV
ncbi:MAG: hypothetical protein SGJ13_18340 [Actinomycetota bacterium]|nr:hypothetical protein [Actinomycetota bacterium]